MAEPTPSTATARRVKPQRASRACLCCRARKVRCDAVVRNPCSNCRWDGTQCVVPRSRRSRKEFAAATADKSAEWSTSSIIGKQDSDDGHDTLVGEAELLASNPPKTSPTESHTIGALLSNLNEFESLKTPLSIDKDPFSQLPPFIRRPSVANSGYAQFLQSQGALTLPSIRLQSILLKAFVEYVYPRMPLVNLEQLLQCVRSLDGSGGQLSLMLYSALLFAGSAHVELDRIKVHGYTNKKQLRSELYKKAELLYDFDGEQDRLVSVQAALLLTCRGVSDKDRKDSWYWMNTAITLAYAINLHRNAANNGYDLSKQNLVRRLWWCCYVRDNLLALSLHRPTRIKDQDFDVPMLEVADMEFDILTRQHSLLESSLVGPFSRIHELHAAEVCIQKTTLCVLINHILLLPEKAVSLWDNAGMMSDTSFSHWNEFDAMDSALRAWQRSLPQSCRYEPVREVDKPKKTPVDVLRHLLHMTYYTALYTLHRPRFLPNSPRQLQSRHLNQAQEVSKAIVLDSANKITHLAAELHHYNMDCNLPIATLTLLCPAISMHLLNMKSQSQDVRNMATYNFRVCMRTVEKLQSLYASTEVTISFLEMALRRCFVQGTDGSGVKSVFKLNKQDRSDVMAVLNRAMLTSEAPTIIAEPSDEAPTEETTAVDLQNVETDFLTESQQLEMLDTCSLSTDALGDSGESTLDIDLDFEAAQELDEWLQQTGLDWMMDTSPLSPTLEQEAGMLGVVEAPILTSL